MYENLREAAKGFNVEINSYTKTKAAFLLNTDKGTMLLKKHCTNREKIRAYADTAESMHNFGFTNIEVYQKAEGRPYIVTTDGLYTLTKCGDGLNCDFNILSQTLSIAATLAKMHISTERLNTDNSLFETKTSEKSLIRRIAEARHIKKWLDKSSSLTDADIVFIKNYENYLQTALSATKTIAVYLGCNRPILCLNEIREVNILIDNYDTVTFINMDNFALSLPEIDLCELIRRYVKRGGDTVHIGHIIKEYTSIRPLSNDKLEFMRQYLSYPHKFFSIVNKYYNSRRVYNSSQIYLKLKNSVIHQNKIYTILNEIV